MKNLNNIQLCFHCQFHIAGPADTPYETGVFEVDLTFPDNYPNALPQVCQITNMYTPFIFIPDQVPNSHLELCGRAKHWASSHRKLLTVRCHFINCNFCSLFLLRLNVSEALSYIEDLFRSIEVDEEVMFYVSFKCKQRGIFFLKT